MSRSPCLFLEGFYRSLLNVINLCVAESYINVTTTAFNVQKFRFLNSENMAVKQKEAKSGSSNTQTLLLARHLTYLIH